MLFAGTLALSPELAARGLADAQQVVDALAPWANGRQYLNFAEHAIDASTGYRPLDWARLQAVRAAVDPGGLLKANHPVRTPIIPAQR